MFIELWMIRLSQKLNWFTMKTLRRTTKNKNYFTWKYSLDVWFEIGKLFITLAAKFYRWIFIKSWHFISQINRKISCILLLCCSFFVFKLNALFIYVENNINIRVVKIRALSIYVHTGYCGAIHWILTTFCRYRDWS